jgi:DNA modification methylase
VGGPVEVDADTEAVARALGSAFDAARDEETTQAHVHGFHSYPARLHPMIAQRCVRRWTAPCGKLLDPFCGSGTVAVEARLLGRKAIGIDLNPLAIELAWCKTRGTTESERRELADLARRVAEHAEDRRRTRAGPTRRYGQVDRELFDPHMLLELDGLASGLRRLVRGDAHRILRLVLSATLTKVSRRAGDSSEQLASKRLASGFAIRFFESKAQELIRQLAAFQAALPVGSPKAELLLGDARALRHLRPESFDLVLSSPPYPGVYDYHSHHEARLRWLRLDGRALRQGEIGSRRQLGRLDAQAAVARWREDFGGCLTQLSRVVTPGGHIVLVLGDTAIGRVPVRADELVGELARNAGLELVGRASQKRPEFHRGTARAFGRQARREHLLLLKPR